MLRAGAAVDQIIAQHDQTDQADNDFIPRGNEPLVASEPS
jgi:hypothetical protein